MKAGFYLNHSFKPQNINLALGALPFKGEMNFSNDANNPLDSGFGYANAALGILSSYYAAVEVRRGQLHLQQPRVVRAGQLEGEQSRLTLDYGLRFVNQQPQHDQFGHSANFFPEQWSLGNAPLLYRAGCPGGVAPCPTTRQAMDPRTGQLLGAGSALYIGQLVPGTGNPTQGLIQQGQEGTSKYGYVWPTVALAPRFGGAYDVTGKQTAGRSRAAAASSTTVRRATRFRTWSRIHRSRAASPCARYACRIWRPRRAGRCRPRRSSPIDTTTGCPRPSSGTAECR